MPSKPKKICLYPGCPKLTTGTYCEEHTRSTNREYNRLRLERDPDFNKRYGRRWHEIRDLYISKHPLCERCEKAGYLVPAEEVHHIHPLTDGGDNSDENLMSLCKSCHTSITFSAAREK